MVCPLFVSLEGGVPLSSPFKGLPSLDANFGSSVGGSPDKSKFPALPVPVAARGSGGLGSEGGRLFPLTLGLIFVRML